MEKLKIKWSQRLPLNKLKELYLSQASGLLNEELLDDVAATLYLRCKDIIAVDEARHGKVRCPFCYANELNEVWITANHDETLLKCGEFSKEFSLDEYHRCTKREQLNMGGAGDAFKRFIKEYEQPALPEKRMLQVDRLIHEFHYSLRAKPDQPTRSVGPNLLKAKLTEVMVFLNDLSGITGESEDLKATADKWQEEKNKFNKMWNWET